MTVLARIGLPVFLWIVWLLYWVLSARSTAATKMRDNFPFRVAYWGAITLAVLLLEPLVPLGPLDARFVAPLDWVGWCGTAITALGIAFSVWARVQLGRYWSSQITLKAGHQLIRTGPYALVRHPIYTGILLGLVGTVLWLGEYRDLLSLPLFVAALWWKARREEALLMGAFINEYADYRRHTGMLLPRLLRS
jgi:protein-S-isoprenylcysteine O-methyltransferase Ste14